LIALAGRTGGRARPLNSESKGYVATAAGRAVVTLNRRHFVRLHLERPNHRGIVVCTFDPDFGALARRIHDAVVPFPDLTGRLIRVNRSP